MSEKSYDAKIADNSRLIKRIEKDIAGKERMSDQDLEKALKAMSEIYKAQIAFLEIARDMKRKIQGFNTETLTKLAEKALEIRGYKTAREARDFANADVLAERGEEFLIIEVKGRNDQVRTNQLVNYEDRMLTQHPLRPVKKIALVLPVLDGNNFVVWGLKQLISNDEQTEK
jgi:hypothetical protein